MPRHAYSLRPDRLDQLHIIAIGDALKGRTRGNFATTSEVIRTALHAAAALAAQGLLHEVVKEPSPFRSKLIVNPTPNTQETQ